MRFAAVRTMLRWAVSPASNARQAEQQQTASDAWAAAGEINRSVDAVLGNLALILTQLDPDSDAYARARRTLSEARRLRDVVNRLARSGTGNHLRNAA
jgi:hypothetical protein